MKTSILTLSIALAFGVLAGCDRNTNSTPPKTTPPTSSAPANSAPGASGAASGASSVPSTPANAGQPSHNEKKEGSNPVQGQVDPKQGEQHKDFQQKGDGAGPKPGG